MSENLGSHTSLVLAKAPHDGVEVYEDYEAEVSVGETKIPYMVHRTRTREEALELCSGPWQGDYESVAFVTIKELADGTVQAIVELLKGDIEHLRYVLTSRFGDSWINLRNLQPFPVRVDA